MSNKLQKIIIDTNSAINKSHIGFFGFREELRKISNVSELFFPQIVIDEIKNHKNRQLSTKRSQMLDNPFMDIAKISRSTIKSHNIDLIIDDILDTETIKYQLIGLDDIPRAFERIYGWAIKNEPPFEIGSDKGFKDAYIACVIYELLDKHDDDCLFLCTKDERLTLTFKNNSRVQIVQDFNDFQRYSLGAFLDQYLIAKIAGECGIEPKNCEIQDGWLNVENNWVIRISEVIGEGTVLSVIIDSEAREILSHSDADLCTHINNLTESGDFNSTHSAIALLAPLVSYLSKAQIERIIRASTENSQIYWVAKDEDVKEFFLPLFEYIRPTIDFTCIDKFRDHFEIIL